MKNLKIRALGADDNYLKINCHFHFDKLSDRILDEIKALEAVFFLSCFGLLKLMFGCL